MANNFSLDPNCKALWRLESGALTSDSISTNTLTDVNTVASDTTNYKEGGGSADFEYNNSECFYRTDANLSSGFPLKSGETNKTFSICLWARFESDPTLWSGAALVAKYNTGTGAARSFQASVTYVSSAIYAELKIGYNSGASNQQKVHASALSLNTWYHITYSYRNSDKSFAIRVRDASGSVVGSDLTGTMDEVDANGISLNTIPLTIGARYYNDAPGNYHDGLIDEIAIFDDVVTADEATAIAKGIYPAAQSKSITDTGSGADAISQLAVALGLTDTGAGADGLAGAASLGLTDTGAGADVLSRLAAALGLTDAGAGADQLSGLLAALGLTDTGSGADAAPSIAAGLSISETGSGADSVSILQAFLKLISDSGYGEDALVGITATFALSDSSVGSDTQSVSAVLSLVDSGSGSDVVFILTAALLKQVVDSGTGSDAISAVSVSLALLDAAFGSDSHVVNVSLSLSDSGSVTDSVTLIQRLIGIVDNCSGTDLVISPSVSCVVADQAVLVDLVSNIQALLPVISDAGVGVDVVVAFLGDGRYRVTFKVQPGFDKTKVNFKVQPVFDKTKVNFKVQPVFDKTKVNFN